ncbi:YggT family protein [Legionella impletisoli]|uniref:YggT family protein n=1 Tax=Legionella impletisoli TaxID=343510 RepID=A0A917JTY2_9GAMM|nr:YggT family protein [Legionella impletisoli]GGI85872.1 YggT family protein [Legionella impletisoli]
MGGLLSAGYFLFSLFFSLVLFILWLRIALQYLRVSVLHPVSQVIHKLTDPLINPINRLFGFNKGRRSRYDWATMMILLIVEAIKIALLSLMFFGALMPIEFFILYILADLIIQPCNLLFYAVLIRAIMSWVNPTWHNPLAEIVYLLTEPLLRLGRRVIPDISGFDFSPILVIVVLKVLTLFIGGLLPVPLL